MATYSLNNGSPNIPFTGYTNMLGAAGTDASANGYVYFNGITQGDERIAKMLRNGAAGLRLRRLAFTLINSGVGTVATETKKQIKWEQGSPGGLIPIESVVIVNRTTNNADQTAISALLYRNPAPATYATDVSGNGGGGKMTAAGGGQY
jgi:hypothetical protein